jgi:hypothetical protein
MLVDTSSGNSNHNVLGRQEESEGPGAGEDKREATLEGESQHGGSDNTTMLNQNQDEETSNEVGEQSSEGGISTTRHEIMSEVPNRDEVSQTLQALAELGTKSISLPQDF